MKIDRKLIDEGYISERKHPECDYYIYNYTPKAQYDRVWNEDTLNCRGLILDGKGNIMARPFPKFFNYEEYGKDTNLGELPSYKNFEVLDKLDGSLGILYPMPNGELRIATRGSFESEQAKVGTEILNKKYKKQLDTFQCLDNFTFLFEIIYKNNRIVVDYGNKRDIILLTVIDNKTGIAWTYDELNSFCKRWAIPLVKKFDGIKDFKNIKQTHKEDNSEGFVVKFDTGLRIKLKFEEYVRLHRLITGVSNRSIWDLLRNKQDINELLDRVPDEFYNWAKNTKQEFETNYQSIQHSSETILKSAFDIKEGTLKYKTRKEVAKYFLEKPNKIYSSIVFAMFDGKPYEDIIWRMLRPKYSRPFKEEI